MTAQALPRPNPVHCAMTREARDFLSEEVRRLSEIVGRSRAARHGNAGSTGARIDNQMLAAQMCRLWWLQDALEQADIVDTRGVAVIGRRVIVEEPDGTRVAHVLVPPGDADPRSGRVAIDSPIGSALLGRHAGDSVDVVAPAGRRRLRLVAVQRASMRGSVEDSPALPRVARPSRPVGNARRTPRDGGPIGAPPAPDLIEPVTPSRRLGVR